MNRAALLFTILAILPQLAYAGGRLRSSAVVQQTFVVNPALILPSGVPVSPFAYVNPLSAVNYGAYYQPQQVYAQNMPVPQPTYAERSAAYRAYISDFDAFIGVWERWQAAQRRAQTGQPPPDVHALDAVPPPVVKPSLVVTRCASCHSPTHPTFAEHKLDLSAFGAADSIDLGQRLEAIRRVTSDDQAVRMPPATERALTPNELGTIVQELSAPTGEP